MIVTKGSLVKSDDQVDLSGLEREIENLKDGEYNYLIYDNRNNRTLPQLKYLFGIVLRTISENLPDHPNVDALYSYFEEIYSPILSCNINGERYEYVNLKSFTSIEVNDVIEKIIHHAKSKWGIDIISINDLKTPEAKAPYAEAYANQWTEYSRNKQIHSK